MPTPMMMGSIVRSNANEDVYLESLKSAVLDKIRDRFNERIQINHAEVNSLKKVQQDLNEGQIKLQSIIHQIEQQQILIKVLSILILSFIYYDLSLT